MIKTNKEDFEYFKRECQRWIDRFGLHDWDITYRHLQVKDAFAGYSANYDGRSAVIKLSKTWEDIGVTKRQQLKKAAFHEVCELMLVNLRIIAHTRNFDPDELDSETHAVVNRLMRILL